MTTKQDEFTVFSQQLSTLVGMDLSYYARNQMERRLGNFQTRYRLQDYGVFISTLKTNPEMLAELKDFLTINFSEFFRNPAVYKDIEEVFFQPASKTGLGKKYRIWSAGCSVGAEVYSLAMLASEYNMLNQCTFLAADIDQTIINKAQAGFYTDNKMLVHVKPELKNKYMPTVTQGGKEGFQIIPALRNAVRFRKMDLLKDNYDGMQDLILCRNVVIYFTAEAQKMLYEKFYNALAKDGILVVGGTERVPRELGHLFRELKPYIYQRID